ncbi:amidophosphoribosyltransferase [Peptoclostridium litorale DSM 5388]|uniref:Amidophosphoribosyltransferase n=1 Tax=Peptoclostridium litorale DSM 5388 TaxID=1121324 RepID=A0A069RC78_PEPLI|nr:amidophosphoribosyltransferase [Peptoclostridium litorale]KDR94393.1 putative amidophosphoribosyltransferase PurF [Peptoclostridium litorale DSM 5388]SIO24625.1 amidophosphoribosyltransferase [Peptoclostridium litorale DSM 5388]
MCGIVGVYSDENVAKDVYYSLFSLQHRGQESCGIATLNGRINHHKGMGLVTDVFKEEQLKTLSGNIGIGHVRYSTAGGSHPSNSQPLVGMCRGGKIAIAHNGNLVNSDVLKERLEDDGLIFQTSIDSEVILYLLARYYKGDDIVDAVKRTMSLIKGAYSLAIMTEKELVAVRDPNGFRPLRIGKRGNDYIVASEDSAIDVIGAEIVRDVEPGEIVLIKDGKMESFFYETDYARRSCCIFEHVYFARNDATIDGINAYKFRVETGELLARESFVDADVVVPVPDSGWAGAIGYSKESGIPFMEGLVKNRYVGRTFIKPTQKEREVGVKLKLNPLKEVIKGKRVILVDDSIVRGTTSKQLIESIRKAGAKEVHLRITSPPVKYSCYFGIDTPRRSKLIASSNPVDKICEIIGADSLRFISIDGMRSATHGKLSFCSACFDGDYPIDPMVESI